MASIPNLGTVGAALDATTPEVFVAVTGPAVWFPGTAGNSLTATGHTIPSTVGLLPLPYTDGTLTITANDIANLDPAAPQFTCSTGQTVAVNRSATNTTTMLVPARTTVYINPDGTVAANQATVPTNAALSIGATEDFVMLWCGQTGNTTTVNGHLYRNGTANTDAARLQSSTNTDLTAVLDTAGTSFTANLGAWTPNLTPVVVALVLNRATGVLASYLFDRNGLIKKATVDASAAGAAPNTSGQQILRNIPGTVSSFAWNTGLSIAPTDTDLAAIAAYLLQNYPKPETAVYLTNNGNYLTNNDNFLVKG